MRHRPAVTDRVIAVLMAIIVVLLASGIYGSDWSVMGKLIGVVVMVVVCGLLARLARLLVARVWGGD